jgi:serine phosphatase RsbU (regulator of sigma subunit)
MSIVTQFKSLIENQMKWFSRQTIARDLSLRLMAMITAIFALSALINYTFWYQRDAESQKRRLEESMRDMRQVLAVPMWTFNINDIKSITASYATSEAISSIIVKDDEGKVIARIAKKSLKNDLRLTRSIIYKKQKIGSLTIGMSTAAARERAYGFYIQNTLLLAVILIGIFFLTKQILERSLNAPLLKVIKGLREISHGEYQHRLRRSGHVDIDAIGREVNRLAEDIEQREGTIKKKAAAEAVIQSEMTVAHIIQNSMVGREDLNRNAAITYFYKPLAQVGGDWFYTIASENRKFLYVFMGDVSGHGLPQSLITTAVLGALRGLEGILKSAQDGYDPSRVIEVLRETTGDVLRASNLSMTAVGARIDLEKQTIATVNAGHTFPIYFELSEDKNSKVKTISSKVQPMLGSVSGSDRTHQYISDELSLPQRSYLIFFTDGFLEVRDTAGYDFSRKLRRVITKQVEPGSVGYVRDQLVHALLKHGGDNFRDDVCLVLIDPMAKESSHAAA